MNLRVAYVCADPGVPVFGTKGASVHVQEITRAWRARGADVHVYCTRLGDEVPTDLADLPVTHIPLPPGLSGAEREQGQRLVAQELADAVRRDGADVVYERYSLFSTTLATLGESCERPPLRILEVNAPLIEEQARHRSLVAEDEAWAALHAQVHAADRVVAVSPPVADWVRRHTAAADRVRVVANGVNVERIAPALGADPAGGPAVVVFVGTLKPWHGLEVLIDAAASAEGDWTLRIVGDGPLRRSLQHQAAARAVTVDFRGAVAPERMPRELADATIAVAPYPASEDHYFSPLKIYEYAAAGLPVVASDIGAIPGIVDHGRTGLLVPPSDPIALAEAIDTLAADRSLARSMGRAGRARAVAEHSWQHALERIVDGLGLRPGPGLEQGTASAGPELLELGRG